jgi:response regulator of citrate/malate metabolism
MKWNTEFTDCDENDTLGYKVHFSQNKIIHESYSGVYTYEIKEFDEKTFEFTDEQVKTIVHALKTNIRVNQEYIDRMYDVCGKTEFTKETAKNIVNGNMCIRTLLKYIEQV